MNNVSHKPIADDVSQEEQVRKVIRFTSAYQVGYREAWEAGYREGWEAGFQEGFQQGREQAKREQVERRMRRRFGMVSQAVMARIAAASESELDTALDRVEDAQGADTVFSVS